MFFKEVLKRPSLFSLTHTCIIWKRLQIFPHNSLQKCYNTKYTKSCQKSTKKTINAWFSFLCNVIHFQERFFHCMQHNYNCFFSTYFLFAKHCTCKTFHVQNMCKTLHVHVHFLLFKFWLSIKFLKIKKKKTQSLWIHLVCTENHSFI